MDSHKPRTYGKRSGTKRKQETHSPVPGRPTTSTSASTSNTKRRKVSPVPQSARTRSPSPNSTEALTTTDEDKPKLRAIPKPNLKTTYARGTTSAPRSPGNGARVSTTQDLSRIFDSMVSPSSSTASPTKLAKRMLARSKTESSIDSSQSMVHEKINAFERTPSLPTLPASPFKARELSNRTSSSSGSLLSMIPPTKSTTRTYAGKFRSFLVTLPASSNSQSLNAEDEFESRESYNSLRTRWDVDNSEDDPYPAMPSPSKSKSNSATPDMSPFRSGKGRSKAANPAVRLAPILYGVSNPLKSISELRNKGESRRFLDELGYLFEGMDGQNGLGLRRASALEITTKLCDEDFARKAKAADFFTRTWDLFVEAGSGKGEDKIMDLLLTFFVALVARDSVSLAELTQRSISPPPSPSRSSKQNEKAKKDQDPSFFAVLFSILATTPPNTDPLMLIAPQSSASDSDLKKAGINKKDRQLLSTIYNTITKKSNLFPESTAISTPLLIAFALHILPPHSIPTSYFPTFLASLRLSLSPDTSTSLASSLSSRWFNMAKAIPYPTTYYHLRLMDSYLLDQWDTLNDESTPNSSAEIDRAKRNDDEMDNAREEWLMDDLGALGVCIELATRDDDDDFFPTRKYLDATLRVLVTLTHTDKLWGEKAVHADYIMGFVLRTLTSSARAIQPATAHDVKKEDEEEGTSDDADGNSARREGDSQALDTLCLALGLLTNLVQSVDEAKDTIREIRLDPSCPLKKRECGQKCTCARRVSGIQILVDVYMQQQVKIESSTVPLAEDSSEAHAEADASFLRGHIAVLFGLLMMGNADNETAVLDALSASMSSSTSSDLKRAKAPRRITFARLVEQAKDFAAFYTAVSGDIVGGEKENTVTADVVKFLERKRDDAI